MNQPIIIEIQSLVPREPGGTDEVCLTAFSLDSNRTQLFQFFVLRVAMAVALDYTAGPHQSLGARLTAHDPDRPTTEETADAEADDRGIEIRV